MSGRKARLSRARKRCNKEIDTIRKVIAENGVAPPGYRLLEHPIYWHYITPSRNQYMERKPGV